MTTFFGVLAPILNDAETSLEKKVAALAEQYTELLLENPDLPIFVISEIRSSPKQFADMIKKTKLLSDSVFIRQIQAKRPDIHPLQFLISLLGMCVFPYVMKPVLEMMSAINEKDFKKMMLDRKQLIPSWTRALLSAK